MDDASTVELIPIDTIERILYDEESYRSFVERTGEFKDINENSYITAINHYMEFAVKHTNNMSETIFERVNYLNLSHGSFKIYDYYEYLSKTQNLVTVDALERILTDDDAFNRFMDFENNREYFDGVELICYLDALNNLVGYYDKSGIEFSDAEKEKIIAIKQKYSLKLKRYVNLEGYEISPDERINIELFNRVTRGLDLTREPFYLARALYIELAKIVSYDPTFLALDQNLDNEQAREIYHKPIGDITLENNNIVCKDWAELYAYFLNRVGIRAVVSGNMHRYVTFDCDGTLLKADATNTVYAKDDFLSMPDIARIQCGLSTGGYTCLEPDKDISLLLSEVDWDLEYKTDSIEEKYNELEKRYLSIKEKEESYEEKVFNSLEFLRRVSANSSLTNFELFKYIMALSEPLFRKNNINGVETKFICVRDSDISYSASCLISYQSEGEYHYIVFTKGVLEEVTKEQLISRIESGNIKLIGKNRAIMGIDKENPNGITK